MQELLFVQKFLPQTLCLPNLAPVCSITTEVNEVHEHAARLIEVV